MECPICYETVRSSRGVRLECGHHLCFGCAHSWIVDSGRSTCPVCRAESNYFSRTTRSLSRSAHLIASFNVLIMHSDSCIDLCLLLRILVFPYRDEWRRPDMKYYLETLRQNYRKIMDIHDDHMPEQCRDLIRQLDAFI